MGNNLTLLGGLSVKEFLREYWQKKPLLVRQAIPGFPGLLSPKQLMDLSFTQDAQARLVSNKRGIWHLQDGPLEPEDISSQDKTKWTLLVQGVNHTLPQAAELLKRFNFIPHARLDDLMVSYAPKSGGVGPHFDSYDVFLLQGLGHRRWQVSAQKNLALVEGAPLRILQNFTIEQEWTLEPGDMLYLPPHYAHNGIAEDDCMTYSIGFRTPSYQELGEQFLVYLQDSLCLDGMYSDPGLKLQAHPGEISSDMLRQVQGIIKQVKWGNSDIAYFLGRYLSEPKPHIFFDPPVKPIPRQSFQRLITQSTICLNLKTQMLCHQNIIFVNGIQHDVNHDDYIILRILADNRQFSASNNLSAAAQELLYQWYLDGFVYLIDPGKGSSK